MAFLNVSISRVMGKFRAHTKHKIFKYYEMTEASVIAGYKVPKRVFFVPELPRNTTGKVQKNLLRGRFADLSS